MRYTNGNYEAFARSRKPKDVEKKEAYIVGGGLAGLAAAVFLIRDGHMAGEKIHVLEELSLSGGSLDGKFIPHDGFVTRGGREMENHFECLWDLFRSIPSLEVEDASVLDEFYWLDHDDPNSSNCRIIHNRGQRAADDGEFTLSATAQKELTQLFMTSEDQLIGKKIEDVFGEEFFESNFWLYWCTMFAFEKWHSAIEMRRYVLRFVHHIDGLPDFTALKFTRYNQYESLVKPLLAYLEEQGVDFQYECTVSNIDVRIVGEEKVAQKLVLEKAGAIEEIPLSEDDLVFVTNGSITESSTQGDHYTPAPISKAPGGSWRLWKNLAAQSPDFGHPEVFYENLPEESWFVSATVTWQNFDVEPYLEKLTHRKLRTGRIVTGGIITIKDSNWMMSFATHRQPHFKEQKDQQTITWVYGLLSNTPGNYIKKPIEQCSGQEIVQELLYHLGVPEAEIQRISKESSVAVPVYMPFITSYFMLREPGDRPLVIPNGSKNLAFIGNFAETERDTVFTTEYSVRTAMEAVYQLLDVERGVPEVFASAYDLRTLAKAVYYLTDKKKITEMELPFIERKLLEGFVKKTEHTYIGDLLKENHLI
ncbi:MULTISPECIES: oleate hydratase [unclassified Enterococcus]|jgi:oleate hydratase|uniref:oleate hydratase n=1 Tax=Enterococcus TaxID=1350 RepID=UPI000A33288A|nr:MULTISPECIES: oleate hydratase [unclassified Enterococcus]MBO1123380.1 oleate hydratase [Enterococcus casseliflavus]AUJ84692.1 oleate hydratase [Enterococcus sp. CR-Ec1]MEC5316556.1 oleate hydratase [Enterococcus casseliflavus]OTO31401.1 myosin-crossreactive antigen [Enterococcus sp. 3C8_DIV0646]TPE01495.1 oleate hydratase [Enterococcus sp. PF-3]